MGGVTDYHQIASIRQAARTFTTVVLLEQDVSSTDLTATLGD